MKKQTFELNDIIRTIKEVLKIDLLKNLKTRKRDIVDARRIYAGLAKNHTSQFLSQIGKVIHKDHSSICHYIKTCNNIKETNKDFEMKYLKCETFLMYSNYNFHRRKMLIEMKEFYENNLFEQDELLSKIGYIVNEYATA
jgi:chromosomal replication initiation ATPase DnaA